MELSVLCRRGVEALDRALSGEVDPANDPLGMATRCTAELRDELIERLRRGDAAAGPLLEQANSLLSELCAAEFPLAGFRRDRLAMARKAWQRLIDEAAQRA